MSLNVFSPNNKVTGGAAFFSFNSKDGSVFVKLIRQIANNANKQGNFDGNNPINVKLTEDEVGDIIRAVRVNGRSSFYHTFGEDKTTGSFSHWDMVVKGKDGKDVKKEGFGLTVNKNGTEIKVGFSLGAAERLSEFLKFALTHIFSADYAADKKKSEEYLKKKNETAAKQPAKKKESEPVVENNEGEGSTEPENPDDEAVGF